MIRAGVNSIFSNCQHVCDPQNLQIQNCRPAHEDFSSLTHTISLTITRLLSVDCYVHECFDPFGVTDRLASWRMKIPVFPGQGQPQIGL